MDVTEVLTFAVEQGASDIHISAGEPPRIRVSGDMKPIKIPPLNEDEVHKMIYDILNDRQRKVFEEYHDLDFAMEIGELGRFRANIFMQHRGMSAVFRTIPTEVLSFETLGLPAHLKQLAFLEKGIVLVTGPTGSGKSTTLAAIIDLINNERESHVLTVEDPIEFVHKSKKSLISQREVVTHTKSFANALKGALREDPDVILVGEMRDLETIALALTAAETGHLVFGTLHTSSAPKTIDRIVDVFPAAEQAQIRTMFSESVQAIISQMLMKKVGGGRIAAQEILLANPAVRNLIRENKLSQVKSIMETSQRAGMQTLDKHLERLIQDGKITNETALHYAADKDKFRKT